MQKVMQISPFLTNYSSEKKSRSELDAENSKLLLKLATNIGVVFFPFFKSIFLILLQFNIFLLCV